jgi:hypothetical protein
LRKLLTVKATTYTQKIHDDRDKRGPTGYMKFVSERWASGDMKGLTPPESSKLISREWKALNESEKKVRNPPFATRISVLTRHQKYSEA